MRFPRVIWVVSLALRSLLRPEQSSEEKEAEKSGNEIKVHLHSHHPPHHIHQKQENEAEYKHIGLWTHDKNSAASGERTW